KPIPANCWCFRAECRPRCDWRVSQREHGNSAAFLAGFLVGLRPLLVGALHFAAVRQLPRALFRERVARAECLSGAVGIALEHETVAVPAAAALVAVAAEVVHASFH